MMRVPLIRILENVHNSLMGLAIKSRLHCLVHLTRVVLIRRIAHYVKLNPKLKLLV